MIAFLVSIALARMLGPEEFGLVGIATIYLGLVQLIVSQGFVTAIIQRDILEPEHLDSAFWFGLGAAILMFFVTMLSADAIAAAFGEPRASGILKWMSPLFVLIALGVVPTAILTKDLSFKALSTRSMASVSAGGAIGCAMAFSGYGVWSLVAQQLTGAIVNTGLVWWSLRWRPRYVFSIRHLRDLHRIGVNIVGNDVVWYFSRRSDQAMVGSQFGAIGLGPYSFASRFVQLIADSAAMPFQSLALPTLMLVREDSARLRAAFRKFVELSAFSSFPIFAGLFMTAADLVDVVFGPRWVAAVPLLRVLSFYGALNVSLSFLNPLMLARGRARLSFVLTVAHALLTLVACALAVRWGVTAVAAATTVVTLVFPLIFMRVYQKALDVRLVDLYAPIAAPSFATAVMALTIGLTQMALTEIPTGIRLTVLIGVGAVSYSMCCFILRPALARELIYFLKGRVSPTSNVA